MEICHHLSQRLGFVWLMLFLRQGLIAQTGLELRAALIPQPCYGAAGVELL